MPTEPLVQPPHLSPSSMGTFNQCPQKFRYSKIDKIPDDPTEATLMGNFVHETLEYFYVLPHEDRNIANLKRLATSTWEQSEWLERIEPWVRGPDAIRMFRWNSWWCLENIFKVENPESVDATHIEYELNGELAGVTLKGFIDRFTVGDSVVISDYKTGKTPRKQWVNDKFLQLKIYGSLSKELGIAEPDYLELLYLKDGTLFRHEFTDEDYEETVVYVTNTKAEIDKACETHEFETRKSILCNWCSYKTMCPAWR